MIDNQIERLNNLSERRVKKYVEQIEDKPHLKQQILINQGKGLLVIDGKNYELKTVEGYIKLPEMDCIESIQSMSIRIFLLPNQKLLVAHDGNTYFRGYKKENTSDCFFLVHAMSDMDDVLVIDTGEENNSPTVTIEDAEDNRENINSAMYDIICKLLNGVSYKVNTSTLSVSKEEEDEWE